MTTGALEKGKVQSVNASKVISMPEQFYTKAYTQVLLVGKTNKH
jgi:hypothetical protein